MRRTISASLSWSLSFWGSAMASPKSLNLFLDDTQLKAIGLFVVQWTFLETEIEFTISCLGVNVDGNQTVPLAFKDKVKRWRFLMSKTYNQPAILRYYEALIRSSESAHNIRSILSHGRVLGDPKKRSRTVAITHHRHRRTGWHVQPYNFNARLILKWANHIGILSTRLQRLNMRYLPGSPSTLPCRFP
jgi:hypothetical protein